MSTFTYFKVLAASAAQTRDIVLKNTDAEAEPFTEDTTVTVNVALGSLNSILTGSAGAFTWSFADSTVSNLLLGTGEGTITTQIASFITPNLTYTGVEDSGIVSNDITSQFAIADLLATLTDQLNDPNNAVYTNALYNQLFGEEKWSNGSMSLGGSDSLAFNITFTTTQTVNYALQNLPDDTAPFFYSANVGRYEITASPATQNLTTNVKVVLAVSS
jgi:hypothetical protein